MGAPIMESNVMPNSSQYHYIKLWFRSTPEPLIFPLAEAAWGRFRRSFQGKKGGFFICATRDGRTLALNLDYVHLAQIWSEEEQESLIGHTGPQARLFFSDGGWASFEAGNPVDLARIFTSLKVGSEDPTLSLTDGHGKLVIFDTGALILLEVATTYVEEGYKQIYLQERGTLPPR
jgi:hypothetical protein